MQSQSKLLPKEARLPIEWISALFKRFQVRYGHKFTSSIDGLEVIAVAEWANGLAGVTGKQIKRGLENWKGPWPPSLPEFREACTGATVGWEYKSLAYVESRKALPAPLCKKEIADREREKLRALGIWI